MNKEIQSDEPSEYSESDISEDESVNSKKFQDGGYENKEQQEDEEEEEEFFKEDSDIIIIEK